MRTCNLKAFFPVHALLLLCLSCSEGYDASPEAAGMQGETGSTEASEGDTEASEGDTEASEGDTEASEGDEGDEMSELADRNDPSLYKFEQKCGVNSQCANGLVAVGYSCSAVCAGPCNPYNHFTNSVNCQSIPNLDFVKCGSTCPPNTSWVGSLYQVGCDKSENLYHYANAVKCHPQPQPPPPQPQPPQPPQPPQLPPFSQPTSEEGPSLGCGNGWALRAVKCEGSYCDNISISCGGTGAAFGSSFWTPYFSEEGPNNSASCPPNSWVTGLDCNGDYCDDISLRCTYVQGKTVGACQWSGWYSEEQAPFVAAPGFYVRAVQCSGSYCDDKRYYTCQMV